MEAARREELTIARRLTLAQHRQHDTLINRILADGAMKPEEKLMAIVMRRAYDYDESLSGQRLAELVFVSFGHSRYAQPAEMYLRLMREDIRRYDAFLPRLMHRETCFVMLPRAKRPCGKGGIHTWITDVETGERHEIVYCTKHQAEGNDYVQAQRALAKDRIIPRPYANTGGRIAAHLPELEWEKYWRKLDPNWEPFPERTPPVITGPLRPVPDLDDQDDPVATEQNPPPRHGLRLIKDET